MTGGFAGSGKEGQGGLRVSRSRERLRRDGAFRKQIESAGFKVNSEINAEDTRIIGAEKPGDSKTSIQVTPPRTATWWRGR